MDKPIKGGQVLEQNLILFSVFIIAGFFIIILGFKFSDKTRKVIETIGAMTFHVGVFGILYYRVPISLFISLVTLVIALFILLDPLKIENHINSRFFKLFGYLILCAAIAFSLQFLTGFPVWPWIVPIVVYLAPYLISPLKKFNRLILLISWLLVFLNTLIVGLLIYSGFNSSFDTSFITKFFPQQGYLLQKSNDTPIKATLHEGIKILDGSETDKKENDTKTDKNKSVDKQVRDSKKPKEVIKTETVVVEKKTPPKKKIESKTQDKPEQTSSGPYLESIQKADEEFRKLQKEHMALKKKHNDLLKTNIKLEKEIQDLKDLVNSE